MTNILCFRSASAGVGTRERAPAKAKGSMVTAHNAGGRPQSPKSATRAAPARCCALSNLSTVAMVWSRCVVRQAAFKMASPLHSPSRLCCTS